MPSAADEEYASGLYLGLMSGTSVDGIDAVLARFEPAGPKLLGALTYPWPEDLRQAILALAQGDGRFDLDRYGQLDALIGRHFAAAARALLTATGQPPQAVTAIGSHGQTVRHRPDGEPPFTLQIGDPAILAECCGIDVVADFRRSDLAAGGQGAPLLPIMHAMLLAAPGRQRVVLNLGGIANISLLGVDGKVSGFDTGPANGLLDAWYQRHQGGAYDKDGAFAAAGRVDPPLLAHLLADPYFALPPPKSTGREYFHLRWLERQPRIADLAPADVQATLLELSAVSIAQAIQRATGAPTTPPLEVLVAGGGVHNPQLMARLAARLAPLKLLSTAEFGIDPDYLEALAFAWLARQRLLRRSGNLPAVTGARGPRCLGAVYLKP